MPVLPENREAGVVRKGAFYNGFAGPVPTVLGVAAQLMSR